MGRQAKAKQQRRDEAVLENAMAVVDEALIEAGICLHILTKIGGHLDEFFLLYPDYVEGADEIVEMSGSVADMIEALKRVVIGDLETFPMDEGNSRLCVVRIPVHRVQAGDITLNSGWYMEIKPATD